MTKAKNGTDKNTAHEIETLYPFLYSGSGSIESLLEEVSRSTSLKAGEIVTLRETTIDELSERLIDCADAMANAFEAGARLLCFGNGGSATDAAAVARAYVFPFHGRPLPALSLAAEPAVLTALSNDVGFDIAFARQVAALGRSGDIAMGLSTSGNSANLLRAFEEANRRGMLTIGIAGYDGGKMAESESIDCLFVVPSASVHRIQEVQTTIYHLLWELTQAALETTGGDSFASSGEPS
jgi:D-sedoheptulose 7-phosphate isomerase